MEPLREGRNEAGKDEEEAEKGREGRRETATKY